MQCPRCQSERIQRDYDDAVFFLRAVGLHKLLCNNCGLVFKAFDPLGTHQRTPSEKPKQVLNRRRGPRFYAHLPSAISLIEGPALPGWHWRDDRATPSTRISRILNISDMKAFCATGGEKTKRASLRDQYRLSLSAFLKIGGETLAIRVGHLMDLRAEYPFLLRFLTSRSAGAPQTFHSKL